MAGPAPSAEVAPDAPGAQHDPLARRATRARLQALRDVAGLPESAFHAALDLLGAPRGAREWRTFLDQASLVLGVGLVASGVLYGVAWNWAAIGYLTRLIAAELFVVTAGIAAAALGPQRFSGRVAAAAALFLLGPLLAQVGIAWQTGADPWELFAAWATLGLPFAAASRLGPAWLLWMVVAMVGQGLYEAVLGWPDPLWGPARLTLFPLLVALGLGLARRAPEGRGPSSVIALAVALGMLTVPLIFCKAERLLGEGLPVVALWVIIVASCQVALWWARAAAPAAVAGISVLVLVVRVMWRFRPDDGVLLFFTTGVVVLLSSMALAAWIRAGLSASAPHEEPGP